MNVAVDGGAEVVGRGSGEAARSSSELTTQLVHGEIVRRFGGRHSLRLRTRIRS